MLDRMEIYHQRTPAVRYIRIEDVVVAKSPQFG